MLLRCLLKAGSLYSSRKGPRLALRSTCFSFRFHFHSLVIAQTHSPHAHVPVASNASVLDSRSGAATCTCTGGSLTSHQRSLPFCNLIAPIHPLTVTIYSVRATRSSPVYAYWVVSPSLVLRDARETHSVDGLRGTWGGGDGGGDFGRVRRIPIASSRFRW